MEESDEVLTPADRNYYGRVKESRRSHKQTEKFKLSPQTQKKCISLGLKVD